MSADSAAESTNPITTDCTVSSRCSRVLSHSSPGVRSRLNRYSQRNSGLVAWVSSLRPEIRWTAQMPKTTRAAASTA